MKKLFQLTYHSVGIGSTIYLLMGMIFTSGETQKQIISVIIMSVMIGLLSVVYSLEKLPLLTACLVHMSGSVISFLIAAFIGNWFPMDIGIFIQASVMFLVLFLAIWGVFYKVEKQKIEELNNRMDNQK